MKQFNIDLEFDKYLNLVGLKKAQLDPVQLSEMKRCFVSGAGQFAVFIKEVAVDDVFSAFTSADHVIDQCQDFWKEEKTRMNEKEVSLTEEYLKNMIRLTAIYKGKMKKMQNPSGSIIFPYVKNGEIHLPFKGVGMIIYKSTQAFLNDWSDLKPYEGCPNATAFIKSLTEPKYVSKMYNKPEITL